MSSPDTIPAWLWQTLDREAIPAGSTLDIGGREYAADGGILRQSALVSDDQAQTRDVFGFKWHKRDTFEGDAFQQATRDWLIERYGDPSSAEWFADANGKTVLLDAGCGAGHTAIALFGDHLKSIRYLGADISTAVDVAHKRFAEAGLPGGFLQSDITQLPLPDQSVDIAYSEGVLHHTDSTENALKAVAQHVRVGGWFIFYVYRRKGPIREFTDDLLRERIRAMDPQDAWDALMPLTKLGRNLGELNVTVNVPEDIDLLEIPAGETDLQRLFYWHVFKAFFRPDLTDDEMNHINFDWYAPQNAFRQSPEEVRQWCGEAGLDIVREQIEPAGITVIARKTSHPAYGG